MDKQLEDKEPKKYSQMVYDTYARARDIRFVSDDHRPEDEQPDTLVWEDY